MVLLAVFALIAGAGTALSPCVLPVLPVVLSGGLTGGRRRPLGIVTGLALSFTFATVALVYVISALGLPDGFLRDAAIVVLILFGISLLLPAIAARIEAPLSRLAGRVRGGSGDGFGSGLLLGGGLGLVYAPCAGPILAGVITVSASQSFTAGRLVIALAYGIGSALTLYALLIGGRRVTSALVPRSGRFQMAMGGVMVVFAVAMLANLDIRAETALARHFPSVLVNPTKSLETSSVSERALARLHRSRRSREGGVREARRGAPLPFLGRAPDFVGNQRWFNTPGGRPLTLAGLRGRVVLVDFWTYSCINCLRTLPYLRAWDAKYRADGLTIVGVHTPEFPFEKDAGNVRTAIAQNGIRYPVVQDNDYRTWDAYRNQYWPAEYLLDAAGQVRLVHFGEGAYAEKERAIRALLADAGARRLGAMTHARGQTASSSTITPESYLGSDNAERFANGPIEPGPRAFGFQGRLPVDHLAYRGVWRIAQTRATAVRGAELLLRFHARRVFLVLGSPGRPRPVRVLLDGRAIPARRSGADVHRAVARAGFQRLYRLVELRRVQTHTLALRFAPGVSGYAFTFG